MKELTFEANVFSSERPGLVMVSDTGNLFETHWIEVTQELLTQLGNPKRVRITVEALEGRQKGRNEYENL